MTHIIPLITQHNFATHITFIQPMTVTYDVATLSLSL
jgi:hypothetical protein